MDSTKVIITHTHSGDARTTEVEDALSRELRSLEAKHGRGMAIGAEIMYNLIEVGKGMRHVGKFWDELGDERYKLLDAMDEMLRNSMSSVGTMAVMYTTDLGIKPDDKVDPEVAVQVLALQNELTSAVEAMCQAKEAFATAMRALNKAAQQD